jgi:SAM-dependent methyltransferase
MSARPGPACLDSDRLLDEISQIVRREAPALSAIFATYAGEASFGRALIDRDLRRLGRGARILEVGTGSFMLSCMLQREGYQVTAIEPTGTGFSHFTKLQDIVLAHAARQNAVPTVLRIPGEALVLEEQFDFAFSLNVMEHVGDVGEVLRRVHRALRPGGIHRFVCPNYAFPYEPHFNIPTLFSRALTQRLLWPWIAGSKGVPDPLGTWASLNWISVRQVRRLSRRDLAVEPAFAADIFDLFLDRAVSEPEFRARRGRLLTGSLDLLRRLNLLRAARLIPVAALPVMDCTIGRPP